MEILNDLLNNRGIDGDISWDEISKEIKEKIYKISKSIKIDLLEKSSHEYVMWDGSFLRCQYMSIANILHDFAHFQIALSHNRNLIDFGLTEGPESNWKAVEFPSIKQHNCRLHANNMLFKNWSEYMNKNGTHFLQEIFASVLGILWCRTLGINTHKIMLEHDWCFISDDDYLIKYKMSIKNSDIITINNTKYILDIETFCGIINSLQENNFIDENYFPTFKLNE